MTAPYDPERPRRPAPEGPRIEDVAGCLAAALFFAAAGILLASHAGGGREAGVSHETTAAIAAPLDARDGCHTFTEAELAAGISAPRCGRH